MRLRRERDRALEISECAIEIAGLTQGLAAAHIGLRILGTQRDGAVVIGNRCIEFLALRVEDAAPQIRQSVVRIDFERALVACGAANPIALLRRKDTQCVEGFGRIRIELRSAFEICQRVVEAALGAIAERVVCRELALIQSGRFQSRADNRPRCNGVRCAGRP